MANPLILAPVVAVFLVLIHLQQASMLSGSLREFWTRHDENARISKFLFALSFCACFIILVAPSFGIICAIMLMGLSLGFGMDEWKH
jgi:hypothetical protein